MAPSRLYARLCHAFLVYFIMHSYTNYNTGYRGYIVAR